MKKIDNQNTKFNNQNSKPGEKKDSLFDDSFFDEEDDDDDDFDFDDDDDDDEDYDDDDEPAEIQTSNKNFNPPVSAPASYLETPAPVEKPAQKQQSVDSLKLENETKNLAQDIQFRLGCELGQVLIPYENLQNLNIGSVVEFNNTLQTLYLCVNNVRVGEGMIVDIDGKIGIKITRWYGKL